MLLVVLPGMDGSGELLSGFSAQIGDDIPTIVVRYPHDRPMGYAELEAFVRALLPKDGRYVLLAESFSGPIAISIAGSAPSGLAGVILSASFARNPRPALRVLRPLLGVLPLKRAPVALLSIVLLGRFSTPQRRAALSKVLAGLPLSSLRARVRAVLDVDVTPALRGVRAHCSISAPPMTGSCHPAARTSLFRPFRRGGLSRSRRHISCCSRRPAPRPRR